MAMTGWPHCWGGNFTFESCCMVDPPLSDPCWAGVMTPALCCSHIGQAFVQRERERHLPPHRVQLVRSRNKKVEAVQLSLLNCSRVRPEGLYSGGWVVANLPMSFPLLAVLTRCLAQEPHVATVLDLFLGIGFTSRALLEGLEVSPPTLRPKELFSFDRSWQSIQGALGRNLGPWTSQMRRLSVQSAAQLPALLRALRGDGWPNEPRSPAVGGCQHLKPLTKRLEELGNDTLSGCASARVWLLEGEPYPDAQGWPQLTMKATGGYAWNGLDVLCGERAPLDTVVIEPSVHTAAMEEWSIIEHVCRPRFVMILSTNLMKHAGWLQARLQAQREKWHEVLQGHLHINQQHWAEFTELLRMRTFSLFLS
eukprot:CAMPEP_0175655832 /NCGR_PEP_ID=MMETSP0097-20121207/12098_1 /TAXON_ID=311494 /ORGANISM="Alexandrium monilatum, Strain CCMP3105" /LENGTH=365 /DNA_ID=CAMNT_0016961889 /DNA_START=1 /DNA_END=1095 /DNA_ORIENTATION=+